MHLLDRRARGGRHGVEIERTQLRGAERLSSYAGTTPYDVDVNRLCATALELARTVESGASSGDLTLQLRG